MTNVGDKKMRIQNLNDLRIAELEDKILTNKNDITLPAKFIMLLSGTVILGLIEKGLFEVKND